MGDWIVGCAQLPDPFFHHLRVAQSSQAAEQLLSAVLRSVSRMNQGQWPGNRRPPSGNGEAQPADRALDRGRIRSLRDHILPTRAPSIEPNQSFLASLGVCELWRVKQSWVFIIVSAGYEFLSVLEFQPAAASGVNKEAVPGPLPRLPASPL